MPRKTKEIKELENDKKIAKKEAEKDNKKKDSAVTKASKSTSRSKGQKASTKKSTASSKKTSTKATTSKNKTTNAKKASTSKKVSSTDNKIISSEVIEPVEYYDLPYRYNQTVVKLLSQTPTNLFIYWDISDEDRENYKKMYGENFFEETKPVLVVHNLTLNYSFEVEINDFANSWYLHVNDSKCEYKIELGRRSIVHNDKINNDYVSITTSNEIEAPNDRVLFNNQQKMVYFRNVKTNNQYPKNISFIRNMGKIYNIYDLYQKIYKDEDINNLSNTSSSTMYKGE